METREPSQDACIGVKSPTTLASSSREYTSVSMGPRVLRR